MRVGGEVVKHLHAGIEFDVFAGGRADSGIALGGPMKWADGLSKAIALRHGALQSANRGPSECPSRVAPGDAPASSTTLPAQEGGAAGGAERQIDEVILEGEPFLGEERMGLRHVAHRASVL